jgi:hypothetical protein
MSTALISASAALLGVILGQIFSRSGEYRKWLRSEQYGVCLSFLKAAEAIHVKAQLKHAFGRKLGPDAHENLAAATLRRMAAETNQGSIPDSSVPGPEVLKLLLDGQGEQARELMQLTFLEAAGPRFSLENGLAELEELARAEESIQLVCSQRTVANAAALRSALITLAFGTSDDSGLEVAYETARRDFIRATRRMLLRRRLTRSE